MQYLRCDSHEKWIKSVGIISLIIVALLVSFYGLDWGIPTERRFEFLFRGDRDEVLDHVRHLTSEQGFHVNLNVKNREMSPEDQRYVGERVIISEKENSLELWRAYRHYLMWTETGDVSTAFGPLSVMRPSQLNFNPGSFYYGGLFLYPVGATLWLADRLDLVNIKNDLMHFIEQPEDYRKAILLGRGLVALMHVACVLFIFWVGREWQGYWVGIVAALVYLMLPAPLIAAKELKPHSVAITWVVLAYGFSLRHLRKGRFRDLVYSSLASGAAAATVIYAGFAILFPLTALISRKESSWAKKSAMVVGLAGAVVLLTNPYVLVSGDVMKASLDTKWYYPQWQPLWVGGANLFVYGAPGTVSAFCGISIIGLMARRVDRRETVWMLSTVFIFLGALFWATLGACPFRKAILIYPFIALICAYGLKMTLAKSRTAGFIVIGFFFVSLLTPFSKLMAQYRANRTGTDAFHRAARWVSTLPAGRKLGMHSPPSPSACPPFSLRRHELHILPAGFDFSTLPPGALPEIFLKNDPQNPDPRFFDLIAAYSDGDFRGDYSASVLLKSLFVFGRKDLLSLKEK